DAYAEEPDKDSTRTVLKFNKRLAPVKVAVFPLMKKPQLRELAEKVQADLTEKFYTEYDEIGSIGKRYRRQDEIGTPFCVTVDYDSLDDTSVTVRDRDSMEQERVSIDSLCDYLKDKGL
ncbi:MAG: His/Gly/Thr/Pro-type tRNA ligase C-terminal domain-containing protein, partial [Candidatus Muiribacteriaceae bacterium]